MRVFSNQLTLNKSMLRQHITDSIINLSRHSKTNYGSLCVNVYKCSVVYACLQIDHYANNCSRKWIIIHSSMQPIKDLGSVDSQHGHDGVQYFVFTSAAA